MIEITCSHCGERLKLPSFSVGKKAKCSFCKLEFDLPSDADPLDQMKTSVGGAHPFASTIEQSSDPFDDLVTLAGQPEQQTPAKVLSSASEPTKDVPLSIGDVVDDRYLVTKTLGSGGSGMVYRVTDKRTEIDFALKVLSSFDTIRCRSIQLSSREFAIAQQLTHHPQLLRINHFDTAGRSCLCGDGICRGRRLGAVQTCPWWVTERRAGRTIHLGHPEPLDFMHSNGILHLDLKPQNLMYDRATNKLKILDFGISQNQKTSTHSVQAGTLCFMSPEQLEGKDCDHRTDIYALGMILHLLLTGEFPFEFNSNTPAEQIIAWHLVSSNEFDGLGYPWRSIVEKCLRVDRSKRYSNCAEICDELQHLGNKRANPALRDVDDAVEELFANVTLLHSQEGSAESTYLVPLLWANKKKHCRTRFAIWKRKIEFIFHFWPWNRRGTSSHRLIPLLKSNIVCSSGHCSLTT